MWTCAKCSKKQDDSFAACWYCGASKQSAGETSSQQAGEGPQSDGPDVDQLIFVGLNGYALALNRDTGEIDWSNNEIKSGYVTLLLDGDRLIVSTNGYIYCLDPLTGQILWNNPLRGYGAGAPTHLISSRGQSSHVHIEQAAAADSAAAAATHTVHVSPGDG
jgi:outer membrane protein assembly factor BamB